MVEMENYLNTSHTKPVKYLTSNKKNIFYTLQCHFAKNVR